MILYTLQQNQPYQSNQPNTQRVYRTLTIQIKQSNKDYNFFDQLTFKAKNLYNLALYHSRQLYIQNNQTITQFQLYKLLKDTEVHKELTPQSASELYKAVYQTMHSFIQASKQFNKHPTKFKARPKLPKYKHKTKGRYILTFGTQQLQIDQNTNTLKLPKKLNDYPIKLPKHINPIDIQSLRIVPQNQRIKLEIVYIKTIETPNPSSLRYIAGLDLGIDNFAATAVYGPTIQPILLNGKGLKSYNKYFNKRLSYLKSRAKLCINQDTTKRIQRLYNKRSNYFNTWMHTASKRMVQYLVQNQVGCLVIGTNKDWKQQSPLSKKINQTFIQIPYSQFINILTYKA